MYTFQSSLYKRITPRSGDRLTWLFKSLFPTAYWLDVTAKSWVNYWTSLSLNFPSVPWGYYHLCHRCSYKEKQEHSHPQLGHGTFNQGPSHAFSPPTLTLRSLFGIFLTRFPDSIYYMNSSYISLSNWIRKTAHVTSITLFRSCLWESALYLPLGPNTHKNRLPLHSHRTLFSVATPAFSSLPLFTLLVQVNLTDHTCTFPRLSSLLWNASILAT